MSQAKPKYLYSRIQFKHHELVIYGLEPYPIEILSVSYEDFQEKFWQTIEILDQDGWEVYDEKAGFLYLRKPFAPS